MTLILDSSGKPVMLADVAPSGVSKVDPNARSGNPRHDTRSGKFGAGGGGARRPTAPANVDQASYLRMLDAVREAARTYSGNLTPENIQAFIKKRAANPDAVNIQAFMQAAAAQQMHDVVDVLEAELHTVKGPKLTAPRGYVAKVLAGASDDDVAEIIQRLSARGISAAKASNLVIGRTHKDRRETVKAKVEATDFDERDWDDVELTEEPEKPEFDPVQLAAQIVEKIEFPAPVVTVTPQITVEAPKPVNREIVRDENGLAVGVREVTDAS